ncbi:ATP-binding cassette domain-containing protein [Candidatus Bathyarchaeota archaeon]|nr:ATP-binding cassette domain-containing protein [Candidatus Bathyarchaeota archaeon]
MIVAENLEVSYKRKQKPVLKKVNAVFDDKSLILGPNGSGKTTFFRAICGLTNITYGRILIDNVNVEEIYAKTGILSVNFPEVLSLLSVKVYELIELYANLTNGNSAFAHNILDELGVSEELLKSKKLHELSAGQVKAVCTAIALSMNAKHVLLDEPFEQLDPARKDKLIKYLIEYDGIIILNTHETWLLRKLLEWKAFFMFEGMLYGAILVEDLLKTKLSFADDPHALIKIKVSGRPISLVKGRKGKSILSLESLDKIYELALEKEKS